MTTARFVFRPALAATAALVLLAGCATGPDANPKDPLEPFNRGVYRFNDAVDRAVLKPVATAYVDVTPSPVRTGVNNFFGNLGDLWSAVNAGLQLRPRETADNLLRFSVNTVLGFGGLLDIASEAGIERTRIDFGQTLGRWGVPSGAYLVLPFFGPSTVRDAGGLVADSAADPVGHVDHVPSRRPSASSSSKPRATMTGSPASTPGARPPGRLRTRSSRSAMVRLRSSAWPGPAGSSMQTTAAVRPSAEWV